MRLYILKLASAILNFFLISYVVRAFPEPLAREYILILGYIVLGALIVGFGIDTGLERYARRLLGTWPKLRLLLLVLAVTLTRVGVLFGFATALNHFRGGSIEVGTTAYVLAFSTFFFTTFSSVLNGLMRYFASATSNLIKAVLRFLMFALPASSVSLNSVLLVEIVSSGIGALYCIAVFFRSPVLNSSSMPTARNFFSFLSWNYLSRFFLNLVSLNTVKILVLRSNHPNAVLYAYAIQLTESVEKFLPSMVLAGKYRPELAKEFDERNYWTLRQSLNALGRNSLLSAAFMATLHLAALPGAFILLQNTSPDEYWPLIATCAFWVFVVNMKYSLNIVSNVLEANYVQFVASLVNTIFFFSIIVLFSVSNPLSILLLMIVAMCAYPPMWLALTFRHMRPLMRATN